MSKRIIAVVAALALAAAFAASAFAATNTTAKLKSFTYNSSTKKGTLVAHNAKGTFKYLLPATASCGYSTGQSGGPLSCKTLTKSKYRGKLLRITWKHKAGKRVASMVVLQGKA